VRALAIGLFASLHNSLGKLAIDRGIWMPKAPGYLVSVFIKLLARPAHANFLHFQRPLFARCGCVLTMIDGTSSRSGHWRLNGESPVVQADGALGYQDAERKAAGVEGTSPA
jgi:hypothetical protein